MMNMGGAPNAPQMPPQAPPTVPMMPAPPPPQPVDPGKLFMAKETLSKPTWDDVIELFHNDRLRSFSIEIETDSTIVADEQGEKQAVSEFFGTVGGFLSQSLPLVEQAPEFGPLVMEMLKYAARRFQAGRTMETTIDETADALLQRLSNPSQPAPDPKMIAAQAQAQAAIIKGQAQVQVEREKTQAIVGLKQQEAQASMGLRQAQAQADFGLEQAKAQADSAVAAIRAQNAVRPA